MRFEPHLRPWAAALMVGLLWATGDGCRRVTSPEVDVRPQSLELRDILLDIVWPDEVVPASIRVRYSNSIFLDFGDPRRLTDTFSSEQEGELLLPDLPITPYLLRISWSNWQNRERVWIYGPFESTAEPVRIDLRSPNLTVRPRLRVGGAEVAPHYVRGQVGTRIDGGLVSGSATADSVLAFRMPSLEPPIDLRWTLSDDPDHVSNVVATYHGELAPGESVVLGLDLFRVFVRVHTHLPMEVADLSEISIVAPGSGDWRTIQSSSRWAPEEVVELWATSGPLELSAGIPDGWRRFTSAARRWVEAAPGDTLDFDIGSLDLRMRCLRSDGSPISYTPVRLEGAGPSYVWLESVTDIRGEVGFLVTPGAFRLDVQGYWQRRIDARSDTLVVLQELE